jgi:hypothetical protein
MFPLDCFPADCFPADFFGFDQDEPPVPTDDLPPITIFRVDFGETDVRADIGYWTTGSTHLIRWLVSKDREPWNLTGATVSLIFTRPDRTTFTKSMDVTSASGGIAEYTTDDDDLDMEGTWFVQIRVRKGQIDNYSSRTGGQQYVGKGAV